MFCKKHTFSRNKWLWNYFNLCFRSFCCHLKLYRNFYLNRKKIGITAKPKRGKSRLISPSENQFRAIYRWVVNNQIFSADTYSARKVINHRMIRVGKSIGNYDLRFPILNKCIISSRGKLTILKNVYSTKWQKFVAIVYAIWTRIFLVGGPCFTNCLCPVPFAK